MLLISGAVAEEIPILGDIPSDIQQIDLTYSETGPPRLSFQFRVPSPPRPSPPPLRPSTAQFDLLPVVKTSKLTGACEAADLEPSARWTVVVRAERARPCQAAIIVRPSTAIDILSYATVSLKGHTSKPVTLALAHDPDQPAVTLLTVTGHFDIRIPLKPIFARLDPTHITTVVFEGDAGEATLTIERFLLERTSALSTTGPRKGFWVWDYRAAVADPELLIRDCRRAGVTRILVQMPDKNDPASLWSAYVRVLERAASSGLEAFALDGYPEAIYDPAPLMEKIARLRRLLPQGHMNGVQLDIEPYLLAQFSDPQDYSLYLRAIEKIKASLGSHARLSMVMPFWFSAKTVHNRPLDFELMDRVDEVAVMSYRTDLDDLRDITEHMLRYGDAVDIPIWLAVETRPLPVDRQVTLVQEPRLNIANAYLDRAGRRLVLTVPPPGQTEGFRLAHEIIVRPERLTFAGKRRHEVQSALHTIFGFPHTSLAGVVIHDMPGYFSLVE
ncbi:MAG TPA: hypothetical protein VL329_01050 [Nitrospiraceae bacterium]|nr:hypothetical protein [Nitrospiraceae bacterium]